MLIWHDAAWADYLYWQQQDKKTLKKSTSLFRTLNVIRSRVLANLNRSRASLGFYKFSRIRCHPNVNWPYRGYHESKVRMRESGLPRHKGSMNHAHP